MEPECYRCVHYCFGDNACGLTGEVNPTRCEELDTEAWTDWEVTNECD